VNDQPQDIRQTPVKQGVQAVSPEPNKIGPATPYDFDGKNLTAYGGLLPVGTLLEKLGFQQLVEETLRVKRQTRVMPAYRFILAMVLACYVGFSRLHHLRFLQREPMLTGIVGVLRLPPQCTFWRFLASLHGSVAGQLLEVQRRLRQRVWEAANVRLSAVVLDTDTTVHTLFGNQMGARKEQRQEELSADSDVFGRDQGIHCRGVAQRRPPDGQTDRGTSGNGICRCADNGENTAGSRGFGFLLLGRGRSV